MKISVALCTYNGASFLYHQLLSILEQTRAVDEMIICDDVSTDVTIQIIEAFQKMYPGIIKLFKNKEQLGAKKNFEKAISLCSGDVIFLSDQDDIWNIDKVKKCLIFLDSNPQLLGVFTNARIINELGDSNFPQSMWEYYCFPVSDITPKNLYDYILKHENIVTGANLAVKKKALDFIIPFQLLHCIWHDEWIALRLSALGLLGLLDEPLTNYRIHPNQQVGMSIFDSKKISQAKRDRILGIIDQFAFDNFFFWKSRLKYLNQLNDYLLVPKSVYTYVANYMHMNLHHYLNSLPWFKRKVLMLKWKLGGLYPFTISELILL